MVVSFSANWKVNLLHTMGFNLQIILLVMMLAMLGSPLGDFISAVVSDKGGRKYPMGIAFVLSAVCAVISGVVVGPKSGTIALIIWGIIQLIMTASIVAGNTMYWTYLAENLPTRFRSQEYRPNYVYFTCCYRNCNTPSTNYLWSKGYVWWMV